MFMGYILFVLNIELHIYDHIYIYVYMLYINEKSNSGTFILRASNLNLRNRISC